MLSSPAASLQPILRGRVTVLFWLFTATLSLDCGLPIARRHEFNSYVTRRKATKRDNERVAEANRSNREEHAAQQSADQPSGQAAAAPTFLSRNKVASSTAEASLSSPPVQPTSATASPPHTTTPTTPQATSADLPPHTSLEPLLPLHTPKSTTPQVTWTPAVLHVTEAVPNSTILMSDSTAPSFTIASTVVDTALVFACDTAHFRDVDIVRYYGRIRVAFRPNRERSDDQSFGSPHEEWDFD